MPTYPLPNDPNSPFCRSLKTLWKPSGKSLAPIRGIYDPETARKAFGSSQSQWGQVLAVNLSQPRLITYSAASAYKYAARSSSRKVWRKYGPIFPVWEAYRQIIADGIAAASQGQVFGEARWSRRKWLTQQQALCACGRVFTLKRVTDRRCPYCRGK